MFISYIKNILLILKHETYDFDCMVTKEMDVQ